MIQDIYPHRFNNSYKPKTAAENDYILIFKNRSVLVHKYADDYSLPKYIEVKNSVNDKLRYIFSIEGENEKNYFLLYGECPDSIDKMIYLPLSEMRYIKGRSFKEMYYIVCTAFHLYKWYSDNIFCGGCSERLIHSDNQRMLMCCKCGREIYPRISPAVIIGVTNGDKILMSKYAGRAYKGYALLAGFAEIGETLEQTVQREVMEEAGLRVKNIRYYKSQPGGIDGNILAGFFCELDGDDTITIDKTELAEANWYSRADIPIEDDGYSLTREMIGVFKNGKI